MLGLKKNLKRIGSACLWFFMAVGSACLYFLFFWKNKSAYTISNSKNKAEKEKQKVYEKIKNENASNLVDNSNDAEYLQSIKDKLKEDAGQRIQNKITEAGL